MHIAGLTKLHDESGTNSESQREEEKRSVMDTMSVGLEAGVKRKNSTCQKLERRTHDSLLTITGSQLIIKKIIYLSKVTESHTTRYGV